MNKFQQSSIVFKDVQRIRYQLQKDSMFTKQELETFLDSESIKHHHFYISFYSYIGIFLKSDVRLTKLKIATYCYFRASLHLDNLFDEKDLDQTEAMLKYFKLSTIYLCQLFDISSKFWQDLISLEALFLSQQKDVNAIGYSKNYREMYELNAQKKTMMSLGFLLASKHLFNLGREIEDFKVLLKNYHVVLQILDDISDFKADLRSDQNSPAITITRNFIEINRLEATSEDACFNVFLLSGIAIEIIGIARLLCNEALALKSVKKLKDLTKELTKALNKLNRVETKISLTIQKNRDKERLSNIKKESSGIIKDSVLMGTEFIKSQINYYGDSADFITGFGLAKAWVPYYVHSLLPTIEIGSTKRTHAGYNSHTINDGDTLHFYIKYLHMSNSSIQIPLIELGRYFGERGGIKTYNNENTLRKMIELGSQEDVSFWCQEHVCVSAAALNSLADVLPLKHKYIKRLCSFLVETQQNTGLWNSYWWTSDVYATSFAVQGLTKVNKDGQYSSIISQALTALVKMLENGICVEPISNSPSCFYSALVLKALKSVNNESFINYIIDISYWLYSEQYSDGSWASQRHLQIPSPQVKNPKTIGHWAKSSFGVNTCVDDHRRIFTTATVVDALVGTPV